MNLSTDWGHDAVLIIINANPAMYSEIKHACRHRLHALRRALGTAHSQSDLATMRLQLLSVIGLIGHPLCYLLWHRLWPQEYDSATLRLVAMLQSGLCLFAPHFSRRWQNVLLLLLLSYQLSFFFTF